MAKVKFVVMEYVGKSKTQPDGSLFHSGNVEIWQPTGAIPKDHKVLETRHFESEKLGDSNCLYCRGSLVMPEPKIKTRPGQSIKLGPCICLSRSDYPVANPVRKTL